MSLVSRIKIVRDALVSVTGIDVYHYWRQVKKKRYVIWSEDSEADSSHADCHKHEQVIHGTVDLFTQTEYDAAIDQIQTALDNSSHIVYRLNSVQYEDETSLIHYEWEWEVV